MSAPNAPPASQAPSTTQGTSRHWCGTLNNYGEGEHDALKQAVKDKCVYGVIGEELAPSTGTPHLQFYCAFNRARGLPYLKTNFSQRANFQICRGTPKENRDYCTKDGDFWEHGELPESDQGHRTDLETAVNFLRSTNGNVQATAMACPSVYVKYAGNLEKLGNRFAKELAKKVRGNVKYVIWIYGATGVGKTRWVTEREDPSNLWISSKDLKWWHGYDQEEAVVLDDYRADFEKFHVLLRILDRYHMDVEIKGGYVSLGCVKRIYVTSCYHPAEVYNVREDVGQLLRRIDEIQYMNAQGELTNVTHMKANWPRVEHSAPAFITPAGFSTATTVLATPESALAVPRLKRTTATAVDLEEMGICTTTTTGPPTKKTKVSLTSSNESSKSALPVIFEPTQVIDLTGEDSEEDE